MCGEAERQAGIEQESQESEAEWLLRPGASVAPFNVVPLLVYSIASGFAQRPVEKGQHQQVDGLVKALEQDLQSLGASYLPIRS